MFRYLSFHRDLDYITHKHQILKVELKHIKTAIENDILTLAYTLRLDLFQHSTSHKGQVKMKTFETFTSLMKRFLKISNSRLRRTKTHEIEINNPKNRKHATFPTLSKQTEEQKPSITFWKQTH